MQSLCLLMLLSAICWGYEVEKVTEPILGGEGPHWNALTQLLYFVDLDNATIHVYDPSTGIHNATHIDGGDVSFIIPVLGTTDEFLVSTGLDVRHVIWDGEQDSTVTSKIIYSALQDSDGSNFTDAKVDRTGRLWAGTRASLTDDNALTGRTGKLYQISPYTGVRSFVEDISISNGLAWTADGTVMYYTDSEDVTIDSFDFDATADNPLSNRQRIYNFTAEGIDGGTDGLTIDTDGNLWLACFDGHQVIAVNPNNGTLLMSVLIDAWRVT